MQADLVKEEYRFSNQWFDANAGYWPALKKYLNDNLGVNLKCLDIGCYEGRSAIWSLENLVGDSGQLTIVDPLCSHYVDTLQHNLKVSNKLNLTRIIKGDSVVELPKLLEFEAEQFDFIYIDGGKTAADNLVNLLVGERLLKMNGLIVVDDYLWGGSTMDARRAPRLGIDLYSHTTMLTETLDTPRRQAAYRKVRPNAVLNEANK